MTEPQKADALAVIPARFASTRFPGKLIALLDGKPVVVHTYERTCQAKRVSDVVIAADDERVAEAVRPFGARVVMTRADHACGTDRIAEVAQNSTAEIIVNVQGDEPLIDPATINAAVAALVDHPEAPMSTVRRLITLPEKIQDPNIVKVVCDERGRALYFSRWPIPYVRDEADRRAAPPCHWQHVGLYAYRRDFLLRYTKMPQTPLERLEKLEQLRVLENGFPIMVVETQYDSVGVDTPEDLEEVRAILKQRKGV